MKLPLLFLLVALTAEAPYPKQSAPVLQSPRAAGELVNAQMVPQTAESIPDMLMWDYDLPLPRDVTFIVHRAPSPHGPWTVFGQTNQPPFRVIPSGFYRVETRNIRMETTHENQANRNRNRHDINRAGPTTSLFKHLNRVGSVAIA